MQNIKRAAINSNSENRLDYANFVSPICKIVIVRVCAATHIPVRYARNLNSEYMYNIEETPNTCHRTSYHPATDIVKVCMCVCECDSIKI